MILPLEIIIVILIATGNLILGTIVYLKNRASNINRTFLGFSLFLTVWIVGAFSSELVKNLNISLILSRVVYTSVILAAVSLFYFSIFFSKEKLKTIVNCVYLGISVVVIYITLFTRLVITEAISRPWGFDLASGRFYFIFISWVLILTILSVYKFFFLYRKSDSYQKQQLLYFLLGFGIFIFANIFFNVFIRQLTGNDIYYRFGNYSSIFLVGFIAYAIVKRELFGIKVILTELLVGLVALILFIELVLSKSLSLILLKSGIFIAFVYLGVSLIKSVLKEIKNAEQIQKAYELEKHAHKELKRLDEAKTQFLMATQHHLRTPLTSMRGYVDLILGGIYGRVPQKLKEVILKFEKSTINEIKIVNELLDISQFQLGKEVVSLKPNIQIEPILNEVIEELKFEAESEGIYLKLEKDEKPLPLIKADPSKLKVALSNIIDNAVKYTNKGGVTVKCQISNDKLQIIVQDTGMGMSEEEQENLFTRLFERGAEAKKVFTTGRGIGLYLTAKIIEVHHGRIWAESEGKGKGSTFYVELPVG